MSRESLLIPARYARFKGMMIPPCIAEDTMICSFLNRMQYLWRTLKIHIRNREWNNVLLTKTVLCIIPLCTKSSCSAYNLIKTFTQLNPSLLENLLHPLDRKSTRLNSSHVAISYAVFCLK